MLKSDPFSPQVYHVLKLSKYLLSSPELMCNCVRLVPGGSQYNMFMKIDMVIKGIDDDWPDLKLS